ncbi:MAG: PAS domain S-box protein [Burkholderiales bacterium]|nr:PAS domain S-box protein [Burkholderiales bacterium]
MSRDLFGRRKNGSEFPVEIGLNPIETIEGVMVLSSIVDISERKRLEERFRRVVESAPNAMVMINDQGRIEMVNTQAERLFDYSRAEMLGQMVEILVPDRFRHAHPEKRTMFFGEPQSRPMGAGRDLFGRRKNGSEFPVEIGLNPIETLEGMMVLSSIVDISDRKQKEGRIQEALKEKDLLLGEIHHRVKNNLQVVHSLLSLQSSMINDVAVKGMLMDSQNRIQSMALIHQTLYQSNNFARVDFGDFLEALVPNLINSYVIDQQRIALKIDAGSVYLPINSAIPCGLLINELITNALKHGFKENRQGQISVSLSSRDNKQILLVVSDTGVGIADGLDIENTETLGLRLVSLLSQQLNGILSIQRCNPTSFSLEFPLLEH